MNKSSRNYIFIALALMLLNGCANNEKVPQELLPIEYSNPIIHADYSDPDVVKVGEKYYMTASSFNCVPGLPLLESENMVNWKLVGYALYSLSPEETFNKPQHGNGVWAPSIRYHNNQFYIFYGDPDFGIYMLTASEITGPWTKPHLVKSGKGWIDPCPFWDDNGDAWLVHAWAGSRAGIKSTLTLHKMSADGKQLLDNGILVFDGHNEHKTVEGPKMYKRNGYYYIFAPAGGVEFGWQLVLRSKNITGPYEYKKVLHQGNSKINGPHQGAWVEGFDNSSWFYHFQDKGAYGRIVHLQPMTWKNDWPLLGIDVNTDGIGEPVESFTIHAPSQNSKIQESSFSDEFNTATINKHWQWHANPSPKWGGPSGYLGFLRLNAVAIPDMNNLWDVPNLLLQKFPAESFSATTSIDAFLHEDGDRCGLLVMGYDYAWLGLERIEGINHLVYKHCATANKSGKEITKWSIPTENSRVYLKVDIDKKAICSFSYSLDDKNYLELNDAFIASEGKWIGAKVGLFCLGEKRTNDAGYINVDEFKVIVKQ